MFIREHLDKVTSGEIKRLMLFIPPRHGKSEMTTVRYPVWRLEREPGLRVVVGAYNQPLASKFARSARRIADMRGIVRQDRRAVEDWETVRGGGYRAVGVGAGITGQGGNLIIIDDPVKSREEAESAAYRERVWDWYTNDLYTRLEPGGAIIFIMTRWHEDDLAGRILASEDAANWTVIRLPALAEPNDPLGRPEGAALCPERYDVEALESIRRVVGDSDFMALYQQRPLPAEGAHFRREWWSGVNRYAPESAAMAASVVGRWISVDTALKDERDNDYTALGVYELTPDYHLIARYGERGRWQFPDLLNRLEQTAQRFNRDDKLRGVIIEDKGSGTSALQSLRMAAPGWLSPLLYGFQPQGSKEYRAAQASLWCERGMVLLPEPCEAASWLMDFEAELFGFPSVAHDDQVDQFTQAILYLENLLAEGYQARIRILTGGE